jgi:putative aldouronate transport system substrate-binding protein
MAANNKGGEFMERTSLKVLGLLVAAMMVLGMAACGKATPTPAPVPTPSAETQASAQPGASSSTAMDTTPITFSLYCGDYWNSCYIDPSWTDPIALELTKRTGVTLKVTVPASDDSEGEMNKIIASNNLPDLIFRRKGASKLTLENGGYTKPLDDLIAQYAPNITKYMSGAFPGWRNRVDGKIYCIGIWYFNKTVKPALNLQVNTLQIRYDMLKDMGFAKLDRSTESSMNSFMTLQDYYALLDQVKAKYPDMVPALVEPAGEPGSYTVSGALDILFRGLGKQVQNGYVWEDGKANSFASSADTAWVLKEINGLYQKGYASINDTTTSDDQRKALLADGKVFSCLGYSSLLSDIQGTLSKDNPEKRFVMFYLVKDASVQNIYMNGETSGSSGTHINSKLGDAETIRAMQFMDYCCSPEGSLLVNAGIEGVHFTKDPSTGWYKPADDVFAGYSVWDANVLKKTGVGAWLDVLPSVAGVTDDGHCYDVNAEYAFSQDKWVMYNNSDWKHYGYTAIVSPFTALDPDTQADAVDADSKISAYLNDRLTNIMLSTDPSVIDTELGKLQAQMKSDGLAALEKAWTDNWTTIASQMNVDPEKINQTPAQQGQ